MDKMLCSLLGTGLLLGANPLLAETTDQELEALFAEGMQALKDDRLKTAVEAFNSILSTAPTLHRAQLELAVAYYRSLRYAEARRLAQQVLDDPATPPQVRVSILAFLAQVDKEEKSFTKAHEFTPSLSVGFMNDSNVTVGPSSDLLDINGNLFTLTAGQKQHDNAVVMSTGLVHLYRPGLTFSSGEQTGSVEWLSQLSLYHREYSELNAYNQTIVSASTGPAWVVLRHWRAALNLRLDKIWLGGSQLGLFSSLNPTVTYQFHNGELSFTGAVTDRAYDAAVNQPREGVYKTIGTAIGVYFRQRKVATQVGLNLFDFNAKTDRFSNQGWEVYTGAIFQAWPQGSLFARAALKSIDYDGLEPLFNVKRSESEGSLRVGFNHQFVSGYLDKWAINGNYAITNNDSNVSLYDYQRRQLTLSLSKSF